ncbi:ABC transporter permease [Egicoccus halophilus]|uniref:Sugar ABC transporter permease n=1 Tax=Egicoccus halophilus TaxID=1670830 RepID=A0A8J3ACB3_9ACTN|nr:ABC transporter permease [Egicoccus halophilus]GGI03469.1 sugar ABC transporter permease [Egicoccus halophilus]
MSGTQVRPPQPDATGSSDAGDRARDAMAWLMAGRLPTATAFVLLAIAFAINVVVNDNFLTAFNIRSIMANALPLAAVAVGQTIIVIGRGIDLSIGVTAALASVVTVTLVEPLGLLPAMAVGLATGAACGLVNGVLVGIVRLQPIVATFATSFVWAGLALWVLPPAGSGEAAPRMPQGFTQGFRDTTLGIPNGAWLLLGLVGLWLLLKRTRFLRHVYAVGGDELAAYATGVRVVGVQVLTYVVGGAFAGLAAFAMLANSGSGDALSGGGLTLISIAALVIGGTRLSGGAGGAGGTVVGVLVLQLLSNIVVALRPPTEMRQLIDGLLVIAALALAGLWSNRRGGR